PGAEGPRRAGRKTARAEQGHDPRAARRGEEIQCVPARRRSCRRRGAAHEGRGRCRRVRRTARTQEQVLIMPSAFDIIARLELKPHPEGGYYRETFRDR